jgi:Cu+-exporting ATPase
VARRLGIADIAAEVLPQEKSSVVERLRRQRRVVAMAGDGVNDAPALAAADVGIAMGTGADVAMESAGVTLLKGDLTGIVRARRLSAATMRNIRQNLFFAFVYNAAGVPIAAGVLYPSFGACSRRSLRQRPWRCLRSASSETRCGYGGCGSERNIASRRSLRPRSPVRSVS